jgi:CBS-domain-containing membrane protein
VRVASQATHARSLMLAADLMRGDVIPLQPDDRIDRALELFVENNLLALPVVDSARDRRVIGIVKRFDIGSAYLRYVHGQVNREPGASAGPALSR